ncbi:MAG: lysylphosphatidylglycerol synthase transmembrane domain-containing protein [Candidatus Micrarchaeia archaeon]
MAAKKKKETLWQLIVKQKNPSREAYFKLVHRVIGFVVILLVASLIVFIGIAIFSKGGLLEVMGTIEHANVLIYLLAFVFQFLSFFVRFFKWRYYLRILKIKISDVKNFVIYLSLYAMNLTPGRIGRVVSAYTVDRVSNTHFVEILPIVSVDIFTDFLGFVVLSLIFGVLSIAYLPFILIVDFVILLPFVFVLSPWLFEVLKRKVLKGKLSEVFALYGDEYFASQSKLNTPRVYLLSLLFTVPAYFLTSLSLYLSLRSLGVDVPLLKSVLVYIVSVLIGIVSFIPGTIGSADVAMVALISSTFGISSSISAAATIMTRLATLWFGVVLGSGFLFFSFRYWFSSKKLRGRRAFGRKVKSAKRHV